MGVQPGLSLCGRGHGKSVFENRVLTKILGPKRDEVTEDWRRLRSEELYDLYSLPILFRKTTEEKKRDWRGMWHEWREERFTRGFGGKPEGKRPIA